jgi:hypothetical protein
MPEDVEVGVGESTDVPFWFVVPEDGKVGPGESMTSVVLKKLVDVYIDGRPNEVVVLLNVTKMVEIAVIVGVI